MTFDWEDLYTSSTQDDLSSDAYYNEQTVYVGTGETATLIAKYMQNHSFIPIKLCTAEGYVDGSYDNPLTDAAGLVLDGPDFSATDVDWSGKLVNKENYALPESIRVFFRYDYGYEYELTQNAQYSGYTYDNTTGVITFRAPSGSGTTVVIRADGVASEGAAAGELSGEVYTRPDGTYGPFDWNLTGGQGKLETAENVNVNYSVKNVAYFTPDAPGVSYITATSKDGKYHVNFAVVSTAVKADVITLNTNSSELNIGDELALTAALSPEPSISDDAALVWVSYNPEVASVDANGVVTAHSAGYAFISVYTAVNNGVSSYCMVKVLPGAEHTHFFGTEWKYDENSHWHECVAEGCDGTIADKAEHTAGDWIVDKEATTEAAGLRHKECTVCHYVMETQVIDKIEKPTEEPTEKPTETPSEKPTEKPTEKPSEAPTVEPTAPSKPAAGNIIKTDSVSTDNASKYDFGIANGTSDLMEKVLSDAQKARVANGESAEIFLDVKNITDSVSENDKQLVESVLDKYKVGAYFDISLMMKVGHDKASKVTKTSGSISLRIRVPEELTGKALKVVRIHDGAATVIDGTYDENTGYFTFDTDAFSTYALIYAETGMIIAPNTGRENNVFAPIAMVGMIIVAGAAFAAVKRRREESAQN
jgi:LPXTG-motif cell wall-anchored protein